MQFRVLGPIEVIDEDGRPLPIAGGRQRALLARLLVARGAAVSGERLIEAVWGDQLPADPANTLQQAIAQLRRLLEPSREARAPALLLRREGGGYLLDLATHELDCAQFEADLAVARAQLAADDPAAAPRLESALRRWRGAAYADVAYADFARAEIESLEERRLEARELFTDATVVTHGDAAAVADLEALVADQPARESAWARLMTALYRSGRQGDALEAFQRARRHLAEELGIDPSPALRNLEARILNQDAALGAAVGESAPAPGAIESLRPPDPTLPGPTTSFIGREAELELLGELIQRERVVTLTGPGGSGKTRLAIEAARIAAPDFHDGVCFVRLDGLDDPALLVSAVAEALEMPENPASTVTDTLIAFLASRRALVVLDNCEHLIEAVATLVEAIAERCPATVVLATSQEALNITTEQLAPVPPLDLPGDSGSPFEALDAVPAVRLFLDRAAAIAPGFEADADALAAIANIVRALDGIPLAIELAAARIRVLAPAEIAERLADRFALLETGSRTAPARQRTLRGAVEWSYALLDEAERRFFDRLGVFAGGFDLDAAASVAAEGHSEQALRQLTSLVDKSLAWSIAVGGRRRYGLLETLRAFASERLRDSGTDAEIRSRHLAYYAALTEELDAAVRSPAQPEAFARFDAEWRNIRAAIGWSLDGGELPLGVRIAAHSAQYWDWSGSLAEANQSLARLLDAVGDHVYPSLGTMLGWAAYFANELGNLERARAFAEAGRRVAVTNDDPYDGVCALSMLALTARVAGDLEAAAGFDEALRRAGDLAGESWWIAWADNHDSLVALEAGNLDNAESRAQASLEAFDAIGDRRGFGWALTACAHVALARGQHADAQQRARAAADLSLAVGDGRNASWAFEIAADAASAAGETAEAAELLGAATALRKLRGTPQSPWRRAEPVGLRERLEASLGAEFAAAWERGTARAESR